MVEQLSQLVKPLKLEKRLRSDGSYETMPHFEYTLFDYKILPKNEAEAPQEITTLDEVRDGKITIDEFMAQFTTNELIELLGGHPSTGVANTDGIGAESSSRLHTKFGIPCAMTADGPAGLRLHPECEIPTTAWPCATLLASSWNPELIYEVGCAGASELLENNLSIWLTPALNIHRNPLCGRNFEYFSEDPLISGKMAGAKVKGIQSMKIAATIKHFACNSKEEGRLSSESIISERALREIYLKGFEICVKESDPWLLMTSYNRLNGHYTSENYELITCILREEWGYKGAVTTDWGCWGIHYIETKAGNDVKMHMGFPESFPQAMHFIVNRQDIEACARRILELLIKLY